MDEALCRHMTLYPANSLVHDLESGAKCLCVLDHSYFTEWGKTDHSKTSRVGQDLESGARLILLLPALMSLYDIITLNSLLFLYVTLLLLKCNYE